jgi:hypothetical protein
LVNGVLRVAVDPKQQINQRGLMRFAKVVLWGHTVDGCEILKTS